MDALEDVAFVRDGARPDIERVLALRHDLLIVRRAVLPLREVCNGLMRFDVTLIAPEFRPYFRNVRDHVIAVVESLDNLREPLKATLGANMMLSAMKPNDVTKQPAAWAAILAAPTVVAGIYGMNFKDMPELGDPASDPAVLGSIVALCLALFFRLERTGRP